MTVKPDTARPAPASTGVHQGAKTLAASRVAVLLSSRVPADLRERVRQGTAPSHDLLALADRLGATVIAPEGRPWGRLGPLSRFAGLFGVAWAGFKRRRDYDSILVDLDHSGAILATLFKLSRTRRRLVVICHGKLSRGWGARMTKMCRLHKQIDRFVCYGPVAAERLVTKAGVPSSQVRLLRHPADHRFWRPSQAEPEPLLVSAGMYRRDYPTLVEAVRGLNVRAYLAAFSPWVDPGRKAGVAAAPENVTFLRLAPAELRDLYARALFVAVPLLETPSQAGTMVIYEAMAMGKALIVTGTTGEVALGLVKEGETGFYVRPGDVQGWREKVKFFLDHPEEAARMGRNARAIVENGLNQERFVVQLAEIVGENRAGRSSGGAR